MIILCLFGFFPSSIELKKEKFMLDEKLSTDSPLLKNVDDECETCTTLADICHKTRGLS